METTYRTGYEKFYAIYLMSAIVGAALFLLSEFSKGMSFDLSKTLALCLYGFFTTVGVMYWELPKSKMVFTLVILCLALQSVQFDIYGLEYQFYYGPYLAIGYRNDSHLAWDVDFSFLRFRGIDDLKDYAIDVKIYFNLVTLFLLYKLIRKPRQTIEEDDLFSDQFL